MGINRWVGSGNLSADPELRSTKGGTQVLNFTVAVNERKKVGDEWEDYANWVDCVMYGSRAQTLSRYLKKGMKVTVEGRWHQNRWEKDGKKNSRWEVILSEVEFMSKAEKQEEAPEPAAPPADYFDEEIPF